MHQKIAELLQGSPYQYRVHEHAKLSNAIRSPQDFANALGYEISRIAKTLFLKSSSPSGYALAVCSVERKVDFDLLAEALGVKHFQVARREELQEQLGYPQYSVSPLAVRAYPIVIDEDLLTRPTVLVGAGEVGIEIELSPADLLALTQAKVLRFTQG
jgi:Cys-tRNA(Pro)/Cys-tRNA(Cys) deacylase